MAKKQSRNSKKTTNGTGRKTPKDNLIGIIVLFQESKLDAIEWANRTAIACYGDATPEDTKAMRKILFRLKQGKSNVVI